MKTKGRRPVHIDKRKHIFICYSHKDRKLVEEFKTMLAPAVRNRVVDIWDDTQIRPGARWKTEIEKALAFAQIGVLLVSESFLASEFIVERELPPLLEAAQRNGAIIFWVCLSPCLYRFAGIQQYQAAHDISKPLDQFARPQRKLAWREICGKLLQVRRHS
jgi:internalin A